MTSRRARRRAFLSLGALALLLGGVWAARYVHGLSLVVRAADLHGGLWRLADLDAVPTTERVAVLATTQDRVRVRIYAPDHGSRQTVLLVSGLHPAGIDEPRLMRLAGELARTRVTVITPDIPELTQFDVTAALTDRIEQAAVAVASDAALAPAGRIGLMGISFSGGLAVVAAGRPALRNRLLYVFALGGHDDLPRVLRYLATGTEPTVDDGSSPPDRVVPPLPPHDYGAAVVLFNVADRLVPPEQVGPLREGVRRFLWASYLDAVDRSKAAQEFAAARAIAAQLPEPAAMLLTMVNNRDVAHLAPLLLPHADAHASSPALSPSRSPAPTAPVFLLHGTYDNVIPAQESRYLAERLRGRVRVHLLVTDLISHAEADQPPHIIDVLRLARFWGQLLAR